MGTAHRIASAWGLCLWLALAQTPGWTQEADPARDELKVPIEPGKELANGIRHFRRGEYEQAAAAFEIANAGRQRLTQPHRTTLDEYRERTRAALGSRNQASLELQRASQALDAKDYEAAAESLRRVETNRFLSAEERQRADELSQRLRGATRGSLWDRFFKQLGADSVTHDTPEPPAKPSTPQEPPARHTLDASPPPAEGPVITTDASASAITRSTAKRLLAEGRDFLTQGDLDRAERWANVAKQYPGWWYLGDSPDKLLRDIAHAREKTAEPAAPADGGLRGFFRFGRKPDRQDQSAVPSKLGASQRSQVMPPAHSMAINAEPMSGANGPVRLAEQDDPQSASSSAPSIGANAPVRLAESGEPMPSMPPVATPSPLVTAFRTPASGPAARPNFPAGEVRAGPRSAAEVPAGPGTSEPKVSAAAPSRLSLSLPFSGLGPRSARDAEKIDPRRQAQTVLNEARQALAEGRIEDAKRLAEETRALDAPYKLFDDTPDRVLAAIEKQERTERTRTNPYDPATTGQAEQILTSAEQAFRDGRVGEAEEMVARAESLSPNQSPSHRRVEQLRAAIRNARAASARAPAPSPQHAPPPPPSLAREAAPLAPSSHAEAVELVEDARAALRQGDYHQAAALAKQAQAMGAPFAPGQDSPEKILLAQKAIRERQQERQKPSQTQQQREHARKLMSHAQQMTNEGFYDEAIRLAEEAIECQAAFDLAEQRPEQLLMEILGKADTAQSLGVRIGRAPRTEGPLPSGSALPPPPDLPPPSDGQRARAADTATEPMPPPPDAAGRASEEKNSVGVASINHRTVPAAPPAPGAGPPAGVAQAEPSESDAQRPAEPDTPANPGKVLLERGHELVELGNFTEARKVFQALAQPAYGMQREAEEGLALVEKTQRAANLYEVGLAALRRGEHDRARKLLSELAAVSDVLTPAQRQQIQEVLSTIPASPGQAKATDMTAVAARSASATDPTISAPPDSSGPIEQARALAEVEAQRVRGEVLRALQEASAGFQKDPEKSIRILEQTLAIVQASAVDRESNTRWTAELQRRIRNYQEERRRLAIESLDKDRHNAQADQRRRQDAFQQQKHLQVSELVTRCNALMDRFEYHEAEAIAHQIMEIDPDNPVGPALIWRADLARKYATTEDIRSQMAEGSFDVLSSAEKSAIPRSDEDPIGFIAPREWEHLTHRRKKWSESAHLGEKSQNVLEIERALSRPVTFQFRGTPLVDVVDFLRDYTGINVVLDRNALDNLSLDPETPITLSLEQVSLKSALKLLLETLHLHMTYQIRNEVLMLTDKQQGSQNVIMRVYPAADLVIPISDYITAGDALSQSAGSIGSASLGGSRNLGGAGAGAFGAAGPMGGALGNLMEEPGPGQRSAGGLSGGGGQTGDISQEVIELIIATVRPDSWTENGGQGSIEYFQPNRSFVVTQTQEVHDELADLLTQLRRLQDLQVTVEVRILSIEETFFEKIGVDFDVSIDNNQDPFIRSQLAGENSPPGTRLTDSVGMGINDGNHIRGTTIGLDPSLASGRGTGRPTANFNINILNSSFAAATVPSLGGIDPDIGGSDFGIAFLNDIDVFLILQAVQGDARSNIMQAPKVTLFNGQTAFVFVGETVPFISDATPVVSAGAVTFDPTISFIPNGTTLIVQAIVSADRRYVRLQVSPMLTTFDLATMSRTQTITGSTGGAFGLVGGVPGVGGGVAATASINIELPTVEITTVITTVTVPDGGTVLLGGLKTHNEERNEFGTPVLSKIPYINRLFKNTATARRTSSTMLMVTPRIIILEEEEENLGVQPP